MNNYDSHMPEQLRATADRLHDSRPEPEDGVLQRVKQQATTRAGSPSRIPSGGFMRSRIAVVAVLCAGLVMTGGSAGLAVSGISGSGSAGKAAYPVPAPGARQQLPPASGNAPESQTGGQPEVQELAGADSGPADTQAPRQAGGGGGRQSLPFTGLAAIPLLLLGGCLTVLGLVMRRRLPGSAVS